MLCLHVYTFTICIPGALRGQRGHQIRSPRTGVKNGIEPPYQCLKRSLDPPQDQTELLTSEPSPHPLNKMINTCNNRPLPFCLT